MLSFLAENAATIIICVILAFIVGAIIFKMIKDKKSGKHSCGCGCESCALSSECNKNR